MLKRSKTSRRRRLDADAITGKTVKAVGTVAPEAGHKAKGKSRVNGPADSGVASIAKADALRGRGGALGNDCFEDVNTGPVFA